MSSSLIKQLTCLKTVNILKLDCCAAFNALTKQEKLYSYYLSRAFIEGNRIVAMQTSYESPALISLFQTIFTYQRANELKAELLKANKVDEGTINDFLIYACNVCGNVSNYRSFGDTKILPALSKDKFETIIHSSVAYSKEKSLIDRIWNIVHDRIFSTEEKTLRLGIDDHGVNTYYSENCTAKDATFIQQFLNENNIQAWNTRLIKVNDTEYKLKLASSEILPEKDYFYNGVKITMITGDYAPIMKNMCEDLKQAMNYASNEQEKQILEKYIQSFTTGDIQAHIDGSALWTKDKGPTVENYQGFIESYRDPIGVRAEYEGFVAVQNKKMTKILADLVANAPVFLQLLPWGKAYERDTFSKPDFTSIDILTYACSGLPSGINIPNYEEVRQNIGFKNVSLGNVICANNVHDRVTFIAEKDQELIKRQSEAFSVQVGLHELLGHGSGKLFTEIDGQYNFEKGTLKNIVNHELVNSWYKDGESWTSLYLDLANPYEECRAESVGMYLSTFPEVLSIFGYKTEEEQNEIMYLNWLNQIRGGIVGLSSYSPELKKWGQAHCQARFVILQVLLQNAPGLVTLKPIIRHGSDVVDDFEIELNKELIPTVGKEAMKQFLILLQGYKSCAMVKESRALFDKYSYLDDEFLHFREIVIEQRKPRAIFVQANLSLTEENEVNLHYEDTTMDGFLQYFVTMLNSTKLSIEEYLDLHL